MTSENEQRALEAILKDNGAAYIMSLEPRDFHDPFYRDVYTSMSDMLSQGLQVDIATLQSFNPKLQAGRLADLDPVTAANAEYFANELKARTRKREAEVLLKEGMQRLKTERDTLEVIDYLTAELLKVSEHRDVSLRKAGEMLFGTIDRLERVAKGEISNDGIMSGYSKLDELTGGFRPGELIIIAARTSIGKTTLALNIAERIALHGQGVAFFSAEMGEDEIMHRLLASVGKMQHACIRHGQLSPSDFNVLTSASEQIYQANLWIDTTPNIKFFDLRNKTRLLRNRGVDIVFVDYLTLIRYGDQRTPRWERVGELSRELKALARELEIPVVVLSQLNRQAEGQKPTLAELRQSGEVEENADIIMLMHRDRNAEDGHQGETSLNIAKHRGGPTGTVGLYLIEAQTRFEEITRSYA